MMKLENFKVSKEILIILNVLQRFYVSKQNRLKLYTGKQKNCRDIKLDIRLSVFCIRERKLFRYRHTTLILKFFFVHIMFHAKYSTVMPSSITSYDILLRRHKDYHIELVSFADFVGNRRFQITLEINRSSYNQALAQNDTEKCEKILNDIAHTICHECIPKGRFLEQVMRSTDNGIVAIWYDLGDGPLVRERIRRGFLGLLFFLPIEEVDTSTKMNAMKEKKVVNVNLADKRFKIYHTSDKSTSSISSSHNNDPESIDHVSIMRRQKTQSISTLSAPTIIPAANIRNDDVLFYGQNSGETFDSNQSGNKRLLHIMRMKCSDHYYDFNKEEHYGQCAGEVIQGLIGVYPETRFLRQHTYTNNTVWCRMDFDLAKTVIKSLMLSASSSFTLDKCRTGNPQMKSIIINGTKNTHFEKGCGWGSTLSLRDGASQHRMEKSRAA